MWVNVFYILALVMSTGVGFVLATRRGENPIGWLLLGLGLVLAVSAVAAEYAMYGLLASDDPLPGARFAALYDEAAWPLLFAPLAAIAFVFPDGRLPSPRWRWVAIGALASCSHRGRPGLPAQGRPRGPVRRLHLAAAAAARRRLPAALHRGLAGPRARRCWHRRSRCARG